MKHQQIDDTMLPPLNSLTFSKGTTKGHYKNPPMSGFEGVVAMEALGVLQNPTDQWWEPKGFHDSQMIYPFSILGDIFSFLVIIQVFPANS